MCSESWIYPSKYILYTLTQIPFFLIYQSLYKHKHLSWSWGNNCIRLAKSDFLFCALECDFIPGLVSLDSVYTTYMCFNNSQQLEPALTNIVFNVAELLLKSHHIYLRRFQTSWMWKWKWTFALCQNPYWRSYH